jgi:hypothetical protein
MVRKYLSFKRGLKLKIKSLEISFGDTMTLELCFVDYSVRDSLLLVQMGIHIAVACANGRNRPKKITN